MSFLQRGFYNTAWRIRAQFVDVLDQHTEVHHEPKRAERGAVMAEYGLLIAVLFLAIVGAVGIFHDELISFFTHAADTVNQGG